MKSNSNHLAPFLANGLKYHIPIKRINLFLIISFTGLCLMACNSNDSENLYNGFRLFPANYFTPDYEEAYTLTGAGPEPEDLTGSYQVHTGTPTIINEQVVIPTSVSITIIDAAKQSTLSNTIIIYYNQNLEQIKVFNTVTTVTYIADTLIAMPERAKPGDRGDLASWTGSDGTRQNGNWVLEEYESNLAKLTFYSDFKDATGNTTIKEAFSRILDTSGQTQQIMLTINYLTPGTTISLIGQKSK